MTEILHRLCQVDPDHFDLLNGVTVAWWSPTHLSYPVTSIDWGMAGWMLEGMPEGTVLTWHEPMSQFGCFVRTKEGYDVGVYGARGFGDTRIEAIAEAYISWKEGQS